MPGVDVNIAELRAFVAIAQLQSFTKAARRLGVSQPGLSMAIRQLEAKLATKLLERNTRNVQLSKSGAMLLSSAERLVENFERTVTEMKSVSQGKVGRVTVACPEGVAAHVIAPTLTRFVVENPEIMVSVYDGDAASVEHLMHSYGADFGVTGYWREHPDFRFTPFTSDRCCIICPRGHPLASCNSVDVHDLDGIPIVALNRDAGVRRLLERTCEAAGVRLVVQFDVARVSTLIEMVAAGLCISVLTELSTPRNAWSSISMVPLRGAALSYPIGVVQPLSKGLAPSAERFVRLLLSEFG
jgi:DNA-binding transcriptional LysR family regulator